MEMELKGKVALVTGAASGHGREYCLELFRQGCSISICDINTEAGEDLLHVLAKQDRDRVIFCPCDVTDYPQFEEAFQTTISKLGGVDIVINNASVMNDRLWELEVDVNLNGVIRGLLLAFRFLGKDRGGPGGIVVNAGASPTINPLISLPVFTATKQAVAAMTRCYGDQYHVNLTGVKVMALCTAPKPAVITGDPRKRLLSGEYEQAWQRDISNAIPIKSEHAAKALIDIIKKAPSGSSWLVDSSKPPTEIKYSLDCDPFVDKVAMVTGGGGGIGLEICKRLLNEGCRAVSIADKDVCRGESALKEIAEMFGNDRAIFIECDVTKSEMLDWAFKNTIRAYEGVDFVVNNAGILNDRKWQCEIATNINGYVVGSLLALQYMACSCKGCGGYLINVISTDAIEPKPGCPIYSMTQAGILGLTRALINGRHYQRTGVKVIGLCTGLTETQLLEDAACGTLNEKFADELQDDLEEGWIQPPAAVAEALIQTICKKKAAIYVVDNGHNPFEVKFPTMEKMANCDSKC
ncbi:PREDICTED: peroxisomal hydratase-dehydrogenase-epimerase-like [Nicrophorus vespilloides]|uniref:15-hydroxyprostaglandin dehydrogenase [NAD(+)] n=1 Tax=Nicrophorus vespilloides TaxID=110193 RepID=A0ABM1N1V8_NICVS|nr:PREDICTED: peroxisomal hydratase-dehydrogenase-epimerase-like [Nicrophorus vespilloides]